MAVKNKNTRGNLSSRELILIFVLLAAGIFIAGYLFYSNYAINYRTQVEHQLSAVTDLKVGELVQWRKERLGDANLFYKNPAFSNLVQRYFEHPEDVDAREQLQSWLAHFQAYDQYARISLLDTRGIERIFISDTAAAVPSHIQQDADKVLQSGEVTTLDLECDEDATQPHMVILIPIFRENDGNVPLGVVVIRIDPYHYFYPLIATWPTPSATAETLIIRRDGNDALFLNELRFRKDTALKLRISLDNIINPAVQAALGNEGIMQGMDYRGVPVIADVRRVPDYPWFMVAHIDVAEVYSRLTQMLWLIIALVGALLIGAGAVVGLIWRQQNIRVYKERAEIADALRKSEAKYRLLADNTTDGVWLLDLNLKLIYCSPSSEKQSGFTLQEIMEMSLEQYFTPDSLKVVSEAFLEEMPKVEGDPNYNPVLSLDLQYYKKDGTAFWAESRFSIIRDKQGKPVSILGQARDITERKQAECALQKSELRYRDLVNNSKNAVAVYGAEAEGEDFIIRDFNQAAESIENVKKEDIIGKSILQVFPGVKEFGLIEVFQRVWRTGVPERHPLSWYHDERISGWRDSYVYKLYSGEIVAIYEDVTARKMVEETLKASEAQYRTLFEMMDEGFCVVEMLYDPGGKAVDYRFVEINPAFEKHTGLQQALGKTIRQMVPDHDQHWFEIYGKVAQTGKAIRFENPAIAMHRHYSVFAFRIGGDGSRQVGILFNDITERKKAEESLRTSESKFSHVFYSSPFPLSLTRMRDGVLTEINDMWTETYGYTRSEACGKTTAELGISTNPEERAHIYALLQEKGNLHNLEVTGYHTKDNPAPIILVNFDTVEFGGEKYVLTSAQDITEHRKAEQALKSSEELYRSLFDNMINGFAYCKMLFDRDQPRDFIYLSVNSAFEKQTGLKNVTGKKVSQVIPGIYETDPQLLETYGRVALTGIHETIEIYVSALGMWFLISVYSPQKEYFVTVFDVITERKLAEEALRASQALLTEAQEVAHIGHWELDPVTMVPTWSKEIFNIFGIDPATGEPSFAAHRDLLHPDDWDILNNAVSATSTTGAPFEIEFRLLHPLKGIRWMLAIGRAVRNDKGNISRLYGTAQDITNHKSTQQNLEKSQQELRSLSSHLINLREEERTILAREIHDELGQALTALKMDLSWLSKKLPEGQAPVAEKIASMLKLVNTTVKAVKRLSTELRPGLLDDLGLVAAIEWQAEEFRERTGIITILSSELDDIMVDNEQATALFRIFQEVLTNVARHAAANRVDVYLHEKDGALELSIRDNGIGIKTKMVTDSNSFGLIGIRERCQHLGGTVDIRGKPGKGTTVIVNLPAREVR